MQGPRTRLKLHVKGTTSGGEKESSWSKAESEESYAGRRQVGYDVRLVPSCNKDLEGSAPSGYVDLA